jgi:membrane-bound metal-dependent hydrolase YbcI (DUF457 family)
MLGRQHLMLSVATVSIIMAPFLENHSTFVLVMFAGAGIGSLIPDIDAPDAAVFHQDLRGLNSDFGQAVNNLIGPVLPYFGYTTKYGIYKPAVKAFDFLTSEDYSFEEKHRTFSHSFLGVFTMTAVTGLYLTPLLLLVELFAPLYLLAFLSAYMTGAFLHMLEDSCTKTGIAWNSPFSETKLKGQISTGKDIKKPRYFLYWLGGLTATTFYLATSTQHSIQLPLLTAGAILVAGLSWLIFFKIICKGELVRS